MDLQPAIHLASQKASSLSSTIKPPECQIVRKDNSITRSGNAIYQPALNHLLSKTSSLGLKRYAHFIIYKVSLVIVISPVSTEKLKGERGRSVSI